MSANGFNSCFPEYVIFIDFYRVRLFADKMNRKRDLVSSPEKAIKAGSLNAMGLIDEILHYVVGLYKEQIEKNIRKNLEYSDVVYEIASDETAKKKAIQVALKVMFRLSAIVPAPGTFQRWMN